MSRGLLQLSGIVADLVHLVDHLPSPGEEVETGPLVITAGGGFNAMVAARRLGASVTYGGTLGTGCFADIVRRDLAEARIAAAHDSHIAMDQGTCSVIVEANGERSFISFHGAERQVDRAHLDMLNAEDFDWLLFTGYSLCKPEAARAFLPWLGTVQRPPLLLFDPGPIVAALPRPAIDAVLQRADWVSANAAEAQVMTGLAPPAAAAALARRRAGAMVRTGADGCWLSTGEGAVHVPGFAVEVTDTTGAGDTHDGAFIAAMMQGREPLAAARFANAAAALSTMRSGPATAPDLDETLRFLAGHDIPPPATRQPQEEDVE